MKIAFGHLRIAPREFWSYSIAEWLAAVDGYMESIGAEEAPEPFTKSDLAALMEDFPDDRNTT